MERKLFCPEFWLGAFRRPGRIALNPMLNDDGKIIGDFTVAKLAENRFFLIGAGVAEHYHMRWFERHMPPAGVTIRAFGTDLVGSDDRRPQVAQCAREPRGRRFVDGGLSIPIHPPDGSWLGAGLGRDGSALPAISVTNSG